MEGNSQTSFIPKKPILSQDTTYENRGVSIVTILTIIIFFGVVALSAGSYLYHGYLASELKKEQETLEKNKGNFDLTSVREIKRLNLRIESAKSLLEQHIAASEFFDILEKATLKNVRFSDLTLKTKNSSAIGGVAVSDNPLSTNLTGAEINFSMTGLARSYNSVALQSDLFNKTEGFREPIFSSLNLNEFGEVSFSVSALVDPRLLLYRKAVGLEVTAGSSNKVASSTPDTSSTNVFNPTSQ